MYISYFLSTIHEVGKSLLWKNLLLLRYEFESSSLKTRSCIGITIYPPQKLSSKLQCYSIYDIMKCRAHECENLYTFVSRHIPLKAKKIYFSRCNQSSKNSNSMCLVILIILISLYDLLLRLGFKILY